MMITTRLKSMLVLSLCLTTLIIIVFAGLKFLQQQSLDKLTYITELDESVEVLRSRLWVLQEFRDSDALMQTEATLLQLKKQLTIAEPMQPSNNIYVLNLRRMVNNLSSLLAIASADIVSQPHQGITSANGMLTARFNITIQTMSEELTKLQRQVLDQSAKQQAFILLIAVIVLLIGSVVLVLLTISTLNSFNQSLQGLTAGIVRLTQGDLGNEIKINSKNELATVIQQFNTMSKRLFETTVKKDALQQEVYEQTKQLTLQTERLKFVAEHDDLTGLYSRSAFERQIDTALARCQRTHSLAAMLFIDLDKFKQVNDTLGHDVGDWVLVTVANRLQHTLRSSDICGRLGGDEFVVWLEPINGIDEIQMVTEKIIDHLSPTILYEETEVNLTVSIGIAVYPNDDIGRLRLIRVADENMYSAKKVAGNSFCFSQFVSKKLINLHLESSDRLQP